MNAPKTERSAEIKLKQRHCSFTLTFGPVAPEQGAEVVFK